MRFRVLALLPPALAVAFALLMAAGALHPAGMASLESASGKMLALAGSLAVAFAFERGDYLRRAWLLSGSCFAFLLVGDALAVSGGQSATMLWARAVVAIVGNGASVVGTWMLAHAFGASGLEHDGSERRRRAVVLAGAVVLAVAVTGWALVADTRDLLDGQVVALTSIASDLGDTVCLALIAPVLQTAIALRGGLLRWPWAFLTASGAAWIFYDATDGLLTATHSAPGMLLVGTEALRMLGNGYIFSAAMAQRAIIAPEATASGPRVAG